MNCFRKRKAVCIFRARDVATRKKYVALVDSVKDNNGEVRVFSSLHVSGERKLTPHVG